METVRLYVCQVSLHTEQKEEELILFVVFYCQRKVIFILIFNNRDPQFTSVYIANK